jgi:hypothetical protein
MMWGKLDRGSRAKGVQYVDHRPGASWPSATSMAVINAAITTVETRARRGSLEFCGCLWYRFAALMGWPCLRGFTGWTIRPRTCAIF